MACDDNHFLLEEIQRSPVDMVGLSRYLHGFILPRWCRIPSINSIISQQIRSFIYVTQSYTIEIQEFSRVPPRGLRTLCSKYCKYFNELGCRVGSARITVCNPLTPKSSARPFAKHHLMIGVKTERRLYAYRDNV